MTVSVFPHHLWSSLHGDNDSTPTQTTTTSTGPTVTGTIPPSTPARNQDEMTQSIAERAHRYLSATVTRPLHSLTMRELAPSHPRVHFNILEVLDFFRILASISWLRITNNIISMINIMTPERTPAMTLQISYALCCWRARFHRQRSND